MKFTKVLFFLFGLMSVFNANAHDTGIISGKVVNQNNVPMNAASVWIMGVDRGTYTNEKGLFTITDITVGEYEIAVSTVGYETVKRTIKIEADKTTILDVVLNEMSLELKEITIKGGAFETRNRTATVHSVNLSTIKDLHLTSPLEVLNQIPGVEIGAYNQGGVADAFMLRGFNGAGHEGQAAIEVDGVSLNEGEGNHDGYADMNLIIPLNISKVDVYKGPSSALFGRFGMAGTLAFETRKGGDYQDLSIKGGSFETVDTQIAIGKPFEVGSKTLSTNFAAQLYKTNGYKQNSKFLKGNLNGRVAYELSDKTDIVFNLMGYSGEWDATGYIPTEQFNDKSRRNDQALNAENDGGSKNFASERVDIHHTFNDNLRLLVFGYAVQQNFQRWSKYFYEPGGQAEDYVTRNVFGTGASLNGKNAIGDVEVNWIGGFEFYNELTGAKNWETENRVKQDLSFDHNFTLHSFSAFGQAEFEVSSYFRPTIGLRYDVYDGNLELNDPGSLKEDRPLNNLSHFSPKIGFRSTLFEGFDFKANVSNGFALPSGMIRYDKDANIDPSEIWQYEASVEYSYNNLFRVNLTGFILNTSKEVSETVPGSGIFVNSGKTRRNGLELGVIAQPIKRLNFNGSLAYIRAEIVKNQDTALEGNEVNNIPRTVANVSVDYTLESGFGARVNVRDVGKYATGLENFFYYKGYTRTDASLFYNFAGGSSHRGQIFVEFNNIFNENYATYVFDNDGPADGQSYSPSALRNFSVGVSYNF